MKNGRCGAPAYFFATNDKRSKLGWTTNKHYESPSREQCLLSKLAVVLFNLGGPDGPDSVEPFLFNMFDDMLDDPALTGIRMPSVVRKGLAKIISSKRAPTSRELYEHIGGGKSLIRNTEGQAHALGKTLAEVLPPNVESKTFIAMRYWHPMSDETASAVAEYGPDEIVLLPLYPQYSTTTTKSSLEDWYRAARVAGLKVPTRAICCYPREAGFVNAVATLIAKALTQASFDHPIRVLLSAHSLPVRIVDGGDPYQWQIEATAAAIVNRLEQMRGLPDFETLLCYQSQVGPISWIGPTTESEIERAAAEGWALVVAPIAFVSEHLETLVELDIEFAQLAKKHGVPSYVRVPTVSVGESFIAALCNLVSRACERGRYLSSSVGPRNCPSSWAKCAFGSLAIDK